MPDAVTAFTAPRETVAVLPVAPGGPAAARPASTGGTPQDPVDFVTALMAALGLVAPASPVAASSPASTASPPAAEETSSDASESRSHEDLDATATNLLAAIVALLVPDMTRVALTTAQPVPSGRGSHPSAGTGPALALPAALLADVRRVLTTLRQRGDPTTPLAHEVSERRLVGDALHPNDLDATAAGVSQPPEPTTPLSAQRLAAAADRALALVTVADAPPVAARSPSMPDPMVQPDQSEARLRLVHGRGEDWTGNAAEVPPSRNPDAPDHPRAPTQVAAAALNHPALDSPEIVTPADVVAQIATHPEVPRIPSGHTLRLQLHPDGLGPLEIALHYTSGHGLTVHVRVESADTGRLVTDGWNELRDALAARGVASDRLIVSIVPATSSASASADLRDRGWNLQSNGSGAGPGHQPAHQNGADHRQGGRGWTRPFEHVGPTAREALAQAGPAARIDYWV